MKIQKEKKIDAAKNLKNHIKYLKSSFEKKLGVTKTFGHLELIGSLPQERHKYNHTGRAVGLTELLDTRVSEHLKHAIQTGICLVVLFLDLSEVTHNGSVRSTRDYNILIS